MGGGNTDFRPAFTYVNQLIKEGSIRHLDGLLYFTDGKGIYPVKKPEYKTAFYSWEPMMRRQYRPGQCGCSWSRKSWNRMHERNNIDWKKTDEYQTGKGRNQTYRNSIFEKDDEGRYKIPLIRQRPVLLMGPPGIGKTQIMEQIAEECKSDW